jgi:acyl dehydratase
MSIFFDDFTLGRVFHLGSVEVTADDIMRFGREFDPQPFHIDLASAEESMVGGLIASGWHICSLFMRLMVDGFMGHSASFGSPGVEVKWLAPARPGDVLHGTSTVIETRLSQSKPDRGIVTLRNQMHNQHGVLVMDMIGRSLHGCRPA